MKDRHAEYFREWLATFPEEVFVIFKVFADESYTKKVKTLGGFMASPEEWAKISRAWKKTLSHYGADYFHFREFITPELYKTPGNAYYGWSEKKRDSFLNDLAVVLSESAIPVGSYLDIKNSIRKGSKDDPDESLIREFYESVGVVLNRHWPNSQKQVLFVYDETDNIEWKKKLLGVHEIMKASEEVGGIAFEDDRHCPPLQAADLLAYIARQTAEKFCGQNNTRQRKRHLDWILSRNRYPEFKWRTTPDQWKRLVKLVLLDRKKKRKIWAKQGDPKRVYYPELDFDGEKYGYVLLNPEKQHD